MVERGITGRRRGSLQERVGRDATEYERRQREDPTPTAREIQQIAAVSEWLGVAPDAAAAALRMTGPEAGPPEAGPDDPIAESIKRVERVLRRAP